MKKLYEIFWQSLAQTATVGGVIFAVGYSGMDTSLSRLLFSPFHLPSKMGEPLTMALVAGVTIFIFNYVMWPHDE